MDQITSVIVAERVTAFFMFAMVVNLLGKPERKRSNYYLMLGAVFCCIELIADSLTYENDSIGGLDISLNLKYFIYFLAYTAHNGTLIFSTLYCMEYIEERTTVSSWLFRFPVVMAVVTFGYQLYLIAQGKIFYYNGSQMINVSSSLPLPVIILTLMSLLYLPIIAFFKAKYIGLRASSLFCLYGSLPAACMVASIFDSQEVDYSPVVAAMAVFLAYVFLQNSLDNEKEEKQKLLQKHKEELEELNKYLEKAHRDKAEYLEKLLAERQAKENYYVQSRFDEATGVYRKGVFLDEAQFYAKQNLNQSFAIIFLDIDNFKSINDTLGHLIGDEAIIKVASVIKTSMANNDLVGRYGGDEFVVLMKDLSKEKLIDKLRLLHNKLQLDFSDSQETIHITCSLGAVYYQAKQGKVSIEELIKQADACLYKVKAAGKNYFEYDDYRQEL